MLQTKSHINRETDSRSAGQQSGAAVKQSFGQSKIQCLLVYTTMNHDPEEVLLGIQEELGNEVQIIGCSTQGIMGPGEICEDGFAVGVIGLGGEDVQFVSTRSDNIVSDTYSKGDEIGRTLNSKLKTPAKAVILLYDPLTGADTEELMRGLRNAIQCPISGGGASQPWGPITKTYQYFGNEVFSQGAVAMAITGNVDVIADSCTGVTSTGLTMTVTKAEGNKLFELDGRRAIDVWQDITGSANTNEIDDIAAWALGVQVATGSGEISTIIRAAFSFEESSGAIIFQAPIREGEQVIFQHRTVPAVVDGTQEMADRLRDRCKTPVRAVLGFECGARTKPFLGIDETRKENHLLQATFAPHAEWLGLLAWGEIIESNQTSRVCNYTFPVLVLSDAA